MDITLREAALEDREILSHLLEKYDYEFSQYDLRDLSPLGLYGYDWLDAYWTDGSRHAFFLRADGVLAGFAMVNAHSESGSGDREHCMAEFCVLYKYRRRGAGRFLAHALFRRFPGKWELKLHPKNLASAAFWPAVVREAAGAFETRENVPGADYDDGTPARFLLFEV